MNCLRRMIPTLALGLMLAVTSVAFAQNATQVKSDNKASCCSCCDDSCPMINKDVKMNHVTTSDKDGCCGCCGDSCDMKTSAAAKTGANSVSSEKHESCCGDSCNMKDKTVTNMKDKS